MLLLLLTIHSLVDLRQIEILKFFDSKSSIGNLIVLAGTFFNFELTKTDFYRVVLFWHEPMALVGMCETSHSNNILLFE